MIHYIYGNFMKNSYLIFLTCIIAFVSGCSDIEMPAVTADTYEYKVSGFDGATADISYRDGDNLIVELTGEELPWTSGVFTAGDEFTGHLYLKADVVRDAVFISFASGTADTYGAAKLIDSTAAFTTSGIVEGDIIYQSATSMSYAKVLSIDSDTTLSLNTDLFSSVPETYYIYHVKDLTGQILQNDEVVESELAENEKVLSVYVVKTVSEE